MGDSIVIFFNKDAINLEDLFLNENWCLSEVFDRVYSVTVGDVKLNWLIKTYDSQKYAKRESKALYNLKKVKGVPKILAVGFSNSLNYIMLSEAPGQDLYEHVTSHGTMTEKEVKNIANQLLKIIRDIHNKHIIHKDIKPENIVYDPKTSSIVLIDFEGKYTQDYRSPEQVNRKSPISSKTDIWSVGITLYYLMIRDVPFNNEKEILHKRISFPKSWSEDFKDFMECLIERNTILRYSAMEALDHTWFQN